MNRLIQPFMVIILLLATLPAFAKTVTVNIQSFKFNPTPITI
jgi:hypothetical protein